MSLSVWAWTLCSSLSAENPRLSSSLHVSLDVYLKRLVLLQHPTPVCDDGAVSSRVASGESQSAAFPSIHVQLVRLSCDLIVATIGPGVRVHEMRGPFNKQTIQAGKTIRSDTNDRDKYTHKTTHTHVHHPQVHPHRANYWHPSCTLFFFFQLSAQHISCKVTNKQMLLLFFFNYCQGCK